MKPNKIDEKFYSRNPDIVAKELLGKILVRKIGEKLLKSRIVETEAYFGEKDPASRASKGENRVSRMMKDSPGKILVYNVHMYKMLNFVTGKQGDASAVLIRALEPINFNLRTSGPGLLTLALDIGDNLHGKDIFNSEEIWLEDFSEEDFEIVKDFRIGVTEDLKEPFRFYIKNNKFVSKK